MVKYKEIKIIGVYILAFILLVSLIKYFIFPDLFSRSHFLNWDAQHYFEIQKNGYEGFLVAFFPLFPMIWKAVGGDVFGIIFLNVLLYLVSFYFLCKNLNLSKLELLLCLSIPSSIFFILPYSESVFFASSTLLIVGVKKEKMILVLIGIFLCTLSRPSFTVLIPALLIMELIGSTRDWKMMRRLFFYVSISLVGIFVVSFIQYIETGRWFEFFKVQQGWGNHLQLPMLPFTTWGGNMIVRLDGIALIFGVLSGVFLLIYILNLKVFKLSVLPKEIILSLAYIGGITLMVLIFRGGSLFSLNRFVFASPFILIVINYFLSIDIFLSKKQLFLIFLLIVLYWLMFGSYVHIQAFLKYFLVSFYVIAFFMIKSKNIKLSKFSYIVLILLNFTFQLVFFTHFLMTKGDIGWVG
jgi:hypothetical protein